MRVKHKDTGKVIEVSEEHFRNVLERQGHYVEAEDERPATDGRGNSPTQKRGRQPKTRTRKV